MTGPDTAEAERPAVDSGTSAAVAPRSSRRTATQEAADFLNNTRAVARSHYVHPHVVQAYLDDVDRDLPGAAQARTLIGVAGTVTTVAAVEIGLAEYDPEVLHHFRLTRDAAEDVFRTLATEPAADRRHNPGLEPARVDVIVGGAAVLVAVMRHWAFEEMIVSEADILDGLIRSQL